MVKVKTWNSIEGVNEVYIYKVKIKSVCSLPFAKAVVTTPDKTVETVPFIF